MKGSDITSAKRLMSPTSLNYSDEQITLYEQRRFSQTIVSTIIAISHMITIK
jgi:hypothetical protein